MSKCNKFNGENVTPEFNGKNVTPKFNGISKNCVFVGTCGVEDIIAWILETGYWNDDGVWDDTAIWKDEP